MVRIKRIYDAPAANDGTRVLVDQLWPRGVSKEKAALGLWLKEVAPSTELREWFGHQPERFEEFRTRYTDELAHNPAVKELQGLAQRNPTLTLLYGAKDPTMNQAVVLRQFLEENP